MEITKELLKQKFEEYNNLYFNNELPMCTFSYNYMRYAFGTYTTHTKSNGQKMGHIRISKSIDLDEEMLRELLVHEMIHHYVRTIDGVFFDGFNVVSLYMLSFVHPISIPQIFPQILGGLSKIIYLCTIKKLKQHEDITHQRPAHR